MAKTKIFFLILLVLAMNRVLANPLPKEKGSFSVSPVIRSLIIPGTGEFQLGKVKRGRTFLLTETLFLVSIYTSRKAAAYQDNAMRSWAADHAQVTTADKPDQFWIDIGNYTTRDAYNEEHQRWRDLDNLYAVTAEWNWSWDSDKNRKRFESIRINRDQWRIAGKFLIGGVVLNHFVSAIDALYLSRVLKKHQVMLVPTVSTLSGSPGLTVAFQF
ncbi:MAG: hypothetical protein ACE5D8_01670 [Fidelibacterota bacterium]